MLDNLRPVFMKGERKLNHAFFNLGQVHKRSGSTIPARFTNKIHAEHFRILDIEINALVNLQINIIFISIFRKVRKMQQIRVSFA